MWVDTDFAECGKQAQRFKCTAKYAKVSKG